MSNNNANKIAVVLFSGGLDSTTSLAIAKSQGFDIHALSFDYGQSLISELDAARAIAKHYDIIKHHILQLPLTDIGGSALTDINIEIPDFSGTGKIPATYVPARNTIFLSVACSLAEVIEARDIFTGNSFIDYSGYPDCRPEYFAAFETMANLATKAGVEGHKLTIHTPLIYLSKADTIKQGLSLGVDYSMTVSCYRADTQGRACGHCDSCALRKKGFDEAGVPDPTRYQ